MLNGVNCMMRAYPRDTPVSAWCSLEWVPGVTREIKQLAITFKKTCSFCCQTMAIQCHVSNAFWSWPAWTLGVVTILVLLLLTFICCKWVCNKWPLLGFRLKKAVWRRSLVFLFSNIGFLKCNMTCTATEKDWVCTRAKWYHLRLCWYFIYLIETYVFLNYSHLYICIIL